MKDSESIIQLMESMNLILVYKKNNYNILHHGGMIFCKHSIDSFKAKKYFFLIYEESSSNIIFQELLEKLFYAADIVNFYKINFPENLMDIIVNTIKKRNFGKSVTAVPSASNFCNNLLEVFSTISVKHLLISGEDFFNDKEVMFPSLIEFCKNCNTNENIKKIQIHRVSSAQFEKIKVFCNNIKLLDSDKEFTFKVEKIEKFNNRLLKEYNSDSNLIYILPHNSFDNREIIAQNLPIAYKNHNKSKFWEIT